MTIAACYVSPEGIVFGADSTSTYGSPFGPHYYNHAQKLFQVGEESTLGIVTWGLGGLGVSSHRMLAALLADDLSGRKPTNMLDVASRWGDQFWQAYTTSPMLAHQLQHCRALAARPAYDPSVNPQLPNTRSAQEEQMFKTLREQLTTGFCIGGYVPPDRTPSAYELLFDPVGQKPVPTPIAYSSHKFWGVPNIFRRLINGYDDRLIDSIASSGKWTGTKAELDALVSQFRLAHPQVPIRDAIDFVHTGIVTTIKAMKFSNFSQVCGGPVEIAVITSDRKFRWVAHKEWDTAIKEWNS